jgi:hypothetical protein
MLPAGIASEIWVTSGQSSLNIGTARADDDERGSRELFTETLNVNERERL